jgi:hypothetical protein
MLGLTEGVIAIAGAAALGVGGIVGRTLLRYRQAAESEEDVNFSPARYRVLERLASDDDARFLATVPGYRPEMAARLRRERRQICRMYLRELAADFRKLHRAARRLVATAPEEHADLVGVLMRQQAAFWWTLNVVELKLTFASAGTGAVDVRGLLETLESLQAAIAPVETATAAI